MDRMNNSKIGIVGVFCAAALLLTAAQSFGNVDNGLFDSSLSSWHFNDGSGVLWDGYSITADGTGSALLQQYGDLETSILWQTFDVDPGSETLNFSIRTTSYGIGETDSLYIDLFDKDNTRFSLFEWDSFAGEYTSPDYFTKTDDGTGLLYYDFSIPVETWDSQSITLQFQLNHCTDIGDPLTTVWVDNVALQDTPSTPPVVPVPGAMGLALSGLAAMGIFARKLV
jgi:hypothetical protein